MPRGHGHISFVFLSPFFFFLEEDPNGKKDPLAVFGCDNNRLFLV